MIRFGRELCNDLDAATEREWLETNGIGGFASSTVIGANTRRYHGLLTAALRPPVGRFVLLSKLEETLILEGRRFELSTNFYGARVTHPQGYRLMREFRLDPFPVSVFKADGVEVEKSIFMIQGENSVVIRYDLRASAGRNVKMEIRPLIAFRDFHATTHENGALNPGVNRSAGLASVAPYSGLPALYFIHDGGSVDTSGVWYRNFRYDRERERGLDFIEDLFNPFTFQFDRTGSSTISIVASTQRDAKIPGRLSACTTFLVRRGERASVIAGYHWFADWGRDTMISLPGLPLSAGQRRDILVEYSRYINQGMLPNCFPDGDAPPEYNSVDAT